MFTYICLGTNDLPRAARFYDAVLGALGLARCEVAEDDTEDGWIGWGTYEDDGQKELALWLARPFDGQPATPGNGTMVALKASTWQQVQAFHAAALAHGGRSEGEPGLWPQYNADFYAAYVRDPDGNKLAAVCRSPVASYVHPERPGAEHAHAQHRRSPGGRGPQALGARSIAAVSPVGREPDGGRRRG